MQVTLLPLSEEVESIATLETTTTTLATINAAFTIGLELEPTTIIIASHNPKGNGRNLSISNTHNPPLASVLYISHSIALKE